MFSFTSVAYLEAYLQSTAEDPRPTVNQKKKNRTLPQTGVQRYCPAHYDVPVSIAVAAGSKYVLFNFVRENHQMFWVDVAGWAWAHDNDLPSSAK